MFVITCVVAGATSHTITNTSKISINQLNNHYRASFIDFILDADLIEYIQTPNIINRELANKHSSGQNLNATKQHNQQSPTVCALLSNILAGNQMKFCQKHQDILETILPQVIQLTKKECERISSNFRWNCTAIDLLLDRSNHLGWYHML